MALDVWFESPPVLWEPAHVLASHTELVAALADECSGLGLALAGYSELGQVPAGYNGLGRALVEYNGPGVPLPLLHNARA